MIEVSSTRWSVNNKIKGFKSIPQLKGDFNISDFSCLRGLEYRESETETTQKKGQQVVGLFLCYAINGS